MILSRVFTITLGFFILLSALAYILMDSRPRQERALDDLDNERFFSILDLYANDKTLEEEDYAVLSLAVSGIEKTINEEKNLSKKASLVAKIKNHHEIQHLEYQKDGQSCVHLEDPYFSYLKKHAYWYQKSLLVKIHSSIFCNPPEKNSEYLNRLLIEDPRNFMRETSVALVELFRTELEPIGELEMGFLKEIVHFLATHRSMPFFENLNRVSGDRVNFRLGPGTEYPPVGQLHTGDELYCFDKDSREETIAGKTGIWKECFSPFLFRSGWIFSPQLELEQPNPDWVQKCKSRFSTLEFYTQIDFDTWNETSMPIYFYGDYIPTNRKTRHGETGFTIFRPKDGVSTLICRKFSGNKNFIEIYYELENAESPIPLAQFQIVAGGVSYPAFRIEVENSAIHCNGQKFNLDGKTGREILSLKVSTGSDSKLSGTLIRKNSGILQNIPALPLEDTVLRRGNYSWEICIPQAVQKSSDSAVLYGFRIGKE